MSDGDTNVHAQNGNAAAAPALAKALQTGNTQAATTAAANTYAVASNGGEALIPKRIILSKLARMNWLV